MRKKVERYISKCQDCQLNKYTIHMSYGHIQYIKITDYLWQDILIDFIVKFSESEDVSTNIKYNSILVIINKLTKYVHFILYRESFKAKKITWIVLNRIIWHHGIPESITSDRDRIFTSKFWRTLMAEIGTKEELTSHWRRIFNTTSIIAKRN